MRWDILNGTKFEAREIRTLMLAAIGDDVMRPSVRPLLSPPHNRTVALPMWEILSKVPISSVQDLVDG